MLVSLISSMTIHQTLQTEIEDSKRWIEYTQEESTYKRDLYKRLELINWVLEKMNDPDIPICEIIEAKMNIINARINRIDDALDADQLHSELRILDWILYQVVLTKNR